MRRRNEKFAKDVREGKKATHTSRADKLAHKSPISAWALGVVIFVVFGGGEALDDAIYHLCMIGLLTDDLFSPPFNPVIFELARLVFLKD